MDTEPELSAEQADRLAESLIEDVLTALLTEREHELDESRKQLRAAQLAVGTAEDRVKAMHRARAEWQRDREVDYEYGERVVMAAKLADFGSPKVPPGTHVRAVHAYFERHPPQLTVDRLTPPERRWQRLVRRRQPRRR